MSREDFMARVLEQADELFPEDCFMLINVAATEITVVTDMGHEDALEVLDALRKSPDDIVSREVPFSPTVVH